MKPIAELLRYLSHPAISEIALTTGRCPMIKSVNGYEPVDSAVLTDEELNRTLLTMVGPARAASVSEKPMKWSVRAEGVATLAVVAVRRGEGLSMRVMRTGDGTTLPPKVETPAPVAAPPPPPEPEPEPEPAPEPSLAEPPVSEGPVDPRDVIPPPVAPLIPPVRRPSVTGLRVIKASSPPGPQTLAPPGSVLPPAPEPQASLPAVSILAPRIPTPPINLQAPPIPTPPVNLQVPASTPPITPQTLAPVAPIALEEPALTPSVDLLEPEPTPAAGLQVPAPLPPAIAPVAPSQPPLPRPLMNTAPFSAPPPVAPPVPAPPVPPAPASVPPGSTALFSSLEPPPPPLPPSEISSIDITIQEEEEPALAQEHTPPLAYRPSLPPRTRPDFWRDLPALMEEARRIGASDLHIVSGRPALFRVSGELKPDGEPLPPKRVEQMVLSQVPARLRATLDSDGSCDFAFQSEASGRFRVNVCRQRTGLKGTFRVISRDVPSLESLGLPLDLALATRHSHGLILVTGPTGHGKTSTLAALVDILNRETKRHILTVEDPVEHVHAKKRALMSQREVGTHTRSFASALKGSLREDADVIVVSELRDAETLRLALAASETGRLVLGTMNTGTAAKTLSRILELFPEAEQPRVRLTLASQLRLILSQRLLPTVNGMGMVAAAEVLPGSAALGQLLRENTLERLASLQQRGQELGAVRLDEALADLVRAGKVLLTVAQGLAEQPEELEALVNGTAPELPPEPGSSGRRLVGPVPGRRSA